MATKFPIKIAAAPKAGAIYWCSLHPENTIHIPEFWKKRPVVVISNKNTLYGKCIVLPMTSDQDNAANANAIELSAEVRSKIDNTRTWVVCDHPMTVATSRLDMVGKTPPRIVGAEFAAILTKVHDIVRPQTAPSPPAQAAVIIEGTAKTTTIETESEIITTTAESVHIEVKGKG